MVLSTYCKQQIVHLYFERRLSYGNIAHVLAAEGLKVRKKMVWATIKRYKEHGTISRLPGSGRRFRQTPEMLAIVEEYMQEDDEMTAAQLLRILNTRGHSVSKPTIIRAKTLLGWTFHGSWNCQMIRNANKERTVEWARENLNKTFENVVWTDESMIMLENHRTFLYRNVGEAPRPKAQAKHPFKVMVCAGISKKGATNICLVNGSLKHSIPGSIAHTPSAISTRAVTRRQVSAGTMLHATRPSLPCSS